MSAKETGGSKTPPVTKWERMAIVDFGEAALERFYERAGKYQFGARLPAEEADKRAYMQEVQNAK